MKFVQAVNIGAQRSTSQIACVQAKETARVLRGTVMTHLNTGIRKLKEHKLLVLRWDDTQFDFITVPKAVSLNEVVLSRVSADSNYVKAEWPGGQCQFDRADIPVAIRRRMIKIVPYCAGDLAYQMLLQGRENHCSSKCTLCKARKCNWRALATVGALFNNEHMQDDWAALQMKYAHEIDHELHPDFDIWLTVYLKSIKEYGFRGCNQLLTSIEISDYFVPILHLLLGIGSDIMNRIVAFIQTYLDEPPTEDERLSATSKHRKPVQDKFFRMLEKKYKITPKRYYTGTLVGGDIHKILKHHDAICDKMHVIFHNQELRKDDVVDDVDAKIVVFVGKIRQLLSVFEVLYSMMSQMTPLSMDELDQFEVLCEGFGKMWRAHFPHCHITPKMHLLESHLPAQMRRFGCLGDKSESCVERYHQIVNRSNRVLACMKGFGRKTMTRLNTCEIVDSPGVKSSLKRTLEVTSRTVSLEKQAEHEDDEEEVQIAKRVRRNAMIDVVNLFD